MLVGHTAAAPPLMPLYDGPYLVTARAPTHFFQLVHHLQNRPDVADRPSSARQRPHVLPNHVSSLSLPYLSTNAGQTAAAGHQTDSKLQPLILRPRDWGGAGHVAT